MDRPCPICAGGERARLYTQDFHNDAVSPMRSYDVVACRRCGFVYADGIPPQALFDEYYATMSKYEYQERNGAVSEDQRAYFAKAADFIASHLADRGTRILDVGCSTGGLLAALQARGYGNLRGLDPSPACAAAVRSLHGIEAVAGAIADLDAGERYGLVVLSATLEHVVDFDGSLRRLRALLDEGGLLFIEVPDAERFADFISAPFQQFSTEHVNYFSRASLANLLAGHGFRALAMLQGENTLHLTTDPDIFALAARTGAAAPPLVRDEVSEPRVREYVARCAEIDREVRRLLRERLGGAGKVIVWGAGTHTQRLLGSGLDPARVLYFVDSNRRYHGKRLGDVEIRPPSAICEPEVPILISSHGYQDEIVRQIRDDLHLPNPIVTLY